jgi:hypothetical protein
MESMNEPIVQLKNNRENFPEKLHMMPIQSRYVGAERLLCNWKGKRVIENTQ